MFMVNLHSIYRNIFNYIYINIWFNRLYHIFMIFLFIAVLLIIFITLMIMTTNIMIIIRGLIFHIHSGRTE